MNQSQHSQYCPYSFQIWNCTRAQGQTKCYCGFDYAEFEDAGRQALEEEIAYLLKRVEKLERASKQLVTRINKVTSHWRHGNPLFESEVDELCNYQIQFEKALEEEK